MPIEIIAQPLGMHRDSFEEYVICGISLFLLAPDSKLRQEFEQRMRAAEKSLRDNYKGSADIEFLMALLNTMIATMAVATQDGMGNFAAEMERLSGKLHKEAEKLEKLEETTIQKINPSDPNIQ